MIVLKLKRPNRRPEIVCCDTDENLPWNKCKEVMHEILRQEYKLRVDSEPRPGNIRVSDPFRRASMKIGDRFYTVTAEDVMSTAQLEKQWRT